MAGKLGGVSSSESESGSATSREMPGMLESMMVGVAFGVVSGDIGRLKDGGGRIEGAGGGVGGEEEEDEEDE